MKKLTATGLALTLYAVTAIQTTIGQVSASLLDGVFTAAQAERGSTAYATSCLSCHSADLRGSSVSPTLRGVGFLFNWEGRPVGELFNAMVENMPTDRPGSLTQNTYADILAYILQVNGYPAADQELAPDQQVLAQLPIVPPAPAAR